LVKFGGPAIVLNILRIELVVNMMNILFFETDKAAGNPYLWEIERILRKHGINGILDDAPFWKREGDYDAIVLQWPEELFNWNDPTDEGLDKLKQTLDYWKSKTKIIVTRHNIIPHNKKDDPQYIKLYQMVLGVADGIVHLGEYSKQEFLSRYKDTPSFKNKIHGVVPHPIYTKHENSVTSQQAREYLGIPENKTVILIFGNIRNDREKSFIREVFSGVKKKNKYLLISNYPLKKSKGYRYLNGFWKWVLNLNPKQKKFYGIVPAQKIQYFLNAADILFIQRKKSLNSGLVFLGFEYTKAVVGPAVANIKDVLEKTKNYTFDPQLTETAIDALNMACEDLPDQETVKQNIKQYYSSEDEIARSYIQFLIEVMAQKK